MNIIIKLSVIASIIIGFILTLKPNLTSSFPVQLTGYDMIEKRVRWGPLIGLGIFLILHQQWNSWGLTLWALLSALTCGIIIARLLGFILDGFFPKQILWLLIELVLFGIFIFLYWRYKPGSRAGL